MIWLSGSQNAKRYFKTICSLHHFFNSSKAVKKFCLFADEKLPKLKKKKYSDYKLEPGEWEILDLVQEVLAVCNDLFHNFCLISYEIRSPGGPKPPSHLRVSQHFGGQFLIWNYSKAAGRLC